MIQLSPDPIFVVPGSSNVGNGLVGSGLTGKNPCPPNSRGGVAGTVFA